MSDGRVKNVEFNYLTLLLRADSEYYARRRNALLYRFTDRKFMGDPRKVGTAYPDEPPISDE